MRHDDGRGRASPDFVDTLPPLRGRVQANAPLAPFTWFRVGGPAEVLVRPADADDLARVPARAAARHAGARDRRLLQPDHSRRRPAGRGRSAWRAASATIAVEADGVVAGAAALDVTVAEHAAAAGLTGLEFLSGIPGTIGGAVAMNAGAYGGDVAHVPRLGRGRHALRRTAPPVRGRSAFAYRHSRLPPGARRRARPACARSRGAPAAIAARMAEIRAAREAIAAGARAHRRLHLPQSAAT